MPFLIFNLTMIGMSVTQKQLAKFSPKVSVETFMNTLGVKYKYIDK